MPLDLPALEQFLRTTFVLGIFAVGGTIFLYICLWGFYSLMAHLVGALGALREWLPKWFASQTALNRAYQISVESNTEALKEMKQAVTETNVVVAKLLAIATKNDYP